MSKEKEYFDVRDSEKAAAKFLSFLFHKKGVGKETERQYDEWRRNPHGNIDYFSQMVPNSHGVSSEIHTNNVRKGLFGVMSSPHNFFHSIQESAQMNKNNSNDQWIKEVASSFVSSLFISETKKEPHTYIDPVSGELRQISPEQMEIDIENTQERAAAFHLAAQNADSPFWTGRGGDVERIAQRIRDERAGKVSSETGSATTPPRKKELRVSKRRVERGGAGRPETGKGRGIAPLAAKTRKRIQEVEAETGEPMGKRVQGSGRVPSLDIMGLSPKGTGRRRLADNWVKDLKQEYKNNVLSLNEIALSHYDDFAHRLRSLLMNHIGGTEEHAGQFINTLFPRSSHARPIQNGIEKGELNMDELTRGILFAHHNDYYKHVLTNGGRVHDTYLKNTGGGGDSSSKEQDDEDPLDSLPSV